MAIKQYPEEINKFKNEWVILSKDDQVVSHGKTPEEAISSARKAGHQNFTLIYVPDEWPNLMTL